MRRYAFAHKMSKFSFFGALLLVFLLSGCKRGRVYDVELTPIMKKALDDTSSIWYADFANFPKGEQRGRAAWPIGIFDSGTGGLALLEVLLTADNVNNITGELTPDGIPDLAGEDFQYLADLANMPYGTYPAEGKEDYLRELAVKNTLFLLGDKYYELSADKIPKGVKNRCKIILVACNTTTAYALKDIENLLRLSQTGVKVIGIVDEGADAAYDHIWRTQKADSISIGVMATLGTVASGAYPKALKRAREERKYTGYVQVIEDAGVGLEESVDVVKDYVNPALNTPRASYRGPVLGGGEDDINEELLDVYNFNFANNGVLYKKEKGKYVDFQLNSAENYARFNLVNLVEKLRNTKEQAPLKCIILGGTHYPYLLNTFNKVVEELKGYKKNGKLIYSHLFTHDFMFIDPARFVALECSTILREENLLALRTRKGNVEPFVSVPSYFVDNSNLEEKGGFTHKFKYGRSIGTEEVTTVNVPFSKDNINPDNIKRIESMVPKTYSKIKEKLK